jgi:hypothetical protein
VATTAADETPPAADEEMEFDEVEEVEEMLGLNTPIVDSYSRTSL